MTEKNGRKPSGPRKSRGKHAYHSGARAEWLAAGCLRLKGYRLIARRYKCRHGEIDLIMQRGRNLIFIEVKQRKTMALAGESVSNRNRRRIEAAAAHFIQAHPRYGALRMRFDSVLMTPWRWPRHIQQAWRLGD